MANLKLNPNYISLHNHSIGSLRDGIMKVSDHIKFALDNNKTHVCITDHGSISEWIELYTQCNKSDVTPIYGVEGYVHLDRGNYLENKKGKPDHIVLLAQNEIGFKNIIKIHNDAWEHHYKKPIMSYDYIKENNEGVIVTTACLAGTLSRLLENEEIDKADIFIKDMKKYFPDRFFIELMFIESDEQYKRNRQLAQIAKKHNVPILINNDAHYLTDEDSEIHQLSLLLQSNKTMKDLKDGNAWTFSASDLYMKTEKDLYKHWVNHYKNDSIITKELLVEATWNVDKVLSSIEKDIYLEHPPRLPHFRKGEEKLTDLVIKGFEKKVGKGDVPSEQMDKYMERVEYELNAIKNMGLTDYFLLIKDVVEFCNKEDIAIGAGRGSVSASLVTWLLSISKLDPIKHNFIFERFLNPARKTKLKFF
jgi:DNA polymerase-3 subunit alpha